MLSNTTQFQPIALQTNYCFDMLGQCHLICTAEFKSFSFLFVPDPEDQNGSSLDGHKDAKLLNCLSKSDILSHNSLAEVWQYTLFNIVCPLESYQNVLQSPSKRNKIEKRRILLRSAIFLL